MDASNARRAFGITLVSVVAFAVAGRASAADRFSVLTSTAQRHATAANERLQKQADGQDSLLRKKRELAKMEQEKRKKVEEMEEEREEQQRKDGDSLGKTTGDLFGDDRGSTPLKDQQRVETRSSKSANARLAGKGIYTLKKDLRKQAPSEARTDSKADRSTGGSGYSSGDKNRAEKATGSDD